MKIQGSRFALLSSLSLVQDLATVPVRSLISSAKINSGVSKPSFSHVTMSFSMHRCWVFYEFAYEKGFACTVLAYMASVDSITIYHCVTVAKMCF